MQKQKAGALGISVQEVIRNVGNRKGKESRDLGYCNALKK